MFFFLRNLTWAWSLSITRKDLNKHPDKMDIFDTPRVSVHIDRRAYSTNGWSPQHSCPLCAFKAKMADQWKPILPFGWYQLPFQLFPFKFVLPVNVSCHHCVIWLCNKSYYLGFLMFFFCLQNKDPGQILGSVPHSTPVQDSSGLEATVLLATMSEVWCGMTSQRDLLASSTVKHTCLITRDLYSKENCGDISGSSSWQ